MHACPLRATSAHLTSTTDTSSGLSRNEETLTVLIEGVSGQRYNDVGFLGVSSVESHAPQGMLLCGLIQADTEVESVQVYEFVNGHADEPETEEPKAYLRVRAKDLVNTECN